MAVELTPDQIKTLLQGISIPPQPQIMVDLQMEQMNPNCSVEAITKLISQDIGLSGSILKTVNSSFFGLKNKIASIHQAINLLGIKSVVNIVNALSIRGSLSDEAIVSLARFWDTAMDIANTCTSIAKQIGYHSPDDAYTIGLFHNCGTVLMLQRFENYTDVIEKAYAQHNQRIIDIENELLNTNHAVVGFYVAKSWKLPITLCETIAEHHSAAPIFADQDYPHTEKKSLLAILKMAEHICGNYRVLGKASDDYEWQSLEQAILEYVGLSQYDFQNMAEYIAELGIAGAVPLKV